MATSYGVLTTIDKVLEENKKEQKNTLTLKNELLKDIPLPLFNYTWLKYLNVSGNNLSRLEITDFPPFLEELDISNNNMSSLTASMFPATMRAIKCQKNQIKTFDGRLFLGLLYLVISKNNLDELTSMPPIIQQLEANDNNLVYVPACPDSLEILDVSSNNIKLVPSLNYGLVSLDMSFNKISVLPVLVDTIKELDVRGNNITKLNSRLPSNLTKFVAFDNGLQTIEIAFPAGLLELDLSRNELTVMPELNLKIQEVDLSDNGITELKDIPESVINLDVSDNKLSTIPDAIIERESTGVLELKYRNNMIEGKGKGEDNDKDQDKIDYFNVSDAQKKFPGVGHTLGSTGNAHVPPIPLYGKPIVHTYPNTSYNVTYPPLSQGVRTAFEKEDWARFGGNGWRKGVGYGKQHVVSPYLAEIEAKLHSKSKVKNSNPNFISINFRKNKVV